MKSIKSIFKEVTGASIGWAVVMVVLGLLAVFLPLEAGVGISLLVAWIMVWGGFAYLAYAFAGRDARDFVWRLLIAIVYVVGGGFLAFHPQIALESLTVVMATIFLIEGVLEIAMFIRFRVASGSGWILFDGLVTLLLAYLVFRHFPSSSAWAIGTILGINLIVSGLTWLMCSIAARRTLEAFK